jgi:hypothetical protein
MYFADQCHPARFLRYLALFGAGLYALCERPVDWCGRSQTWLAVMILLFTPPSVGAADRRILSCAYPIGDSC